jgi:replicative superfamily II helicase
MYVHVRHSMSLVRSSCFCLLTESTCPCGRRYVGDSEVTSPGDTPGYKEYERSVCLQMVGRAGRPQFDTEGVAVIMTSREVSCVSS